MMKKLKYYTELFEGYYVYNYEYIDDKDFVIEMINSFIFFGKYKYVNILNNTESCGNKGKIKFIEKDCFGCQENFYNETDTWTETKCIFYKNTDIKTLNLILELLIYNTTQELFYFPYVFDYYGYNYNKEKDFNRYSKFVHFISKYYNNFEFDVDIFPKKYEDYLRYKDMNKFNI